MATHKIVRRIVAAVIGIAMGTALLQGSCASGVIDAASFDGKNGSVDSQLMRGIELPNVMNLRPLTR